MSATAPALKTAWRRPRGAAGWLSDTSHRATGSRLVGTTLGFFVLAGLLALVLRAQLARPDGDVVGPQTYEQVFSTHGATMLFLFAVPVMQGFALYLIPLELGTREAALPRLAAFGYWLIAFAGVGMFGALAVGEAPASGWFSYVPLASPRYEPGFHGDVYAAVVILSQSGVICLAIALIATILTKRAPGMNLNVMPLLSWAVLIAMAMVLLAMPPVVVDATLLVFDSKLGTQFFAAAAGGDPVLWQQLFWFYAHPLVYIMLLPGLGIVSTITASFAKRPMAGYPFVVTSYVAIGCISFGVWVHHMFTGGHTSAGMAVFSAASMAVAVPSGVHVFAVLATLWHGRVHFTVPLLWVFGFLMVFVLGGISGVMVASITADWQYHDTYFVVAHLHFVLLGGVVMPVLGGISYWYAKVTGWELGRRLGVVAFALILVGVALTFFPMHFAGVLGMPRRVWTYAEESGWSGLNLASSIGAALTALGVAVFVANLAISVGRRRAGPDPWGSGTLEWTLGSPPPRHGFDATPEVTERYPLWEQESLGDADARYGVDASETIGTTAAAARPVWREPRPAPSPMPMVAAGCVAAGVLGTALDPLFLGAGLLLAFIAVVEWLTPRVPPSPGTLPEAEVAAAAGARTPVRWGTALGLFVLFVALTSLVWSWYYLAAVDRVWPIPPVEPRPWLWAIGLTILLGGAVAACLLGLRRVRDGGRAAARFAAAAALALGFVALEAVESLDLDYDQAANASASAEFAIAWSFALCVLLLAGMAGVIARHAAAGRFGPDRRQAPTSLAAYAGLLALGWPLVLITVYAGPRFL